ncbi:MAG: M20 family metallopeptidase [Dehalococcoidia bacterium]|nr:M20 family metallopeptidase [Dehalococcoidia bacterium]
MFINDLKAEVIRAVDLQERSLIQLSRKIHDHPEMSFQEEKAAAWLSDYLQDGGFLLERGIAGLPTAFRATYGQGEPRIALLAEYDALPGMGHACGHNLIAAAAVGAGMAGKLIVDSFGGSLVVLGTPGEESFGGKIDMVEKGIFDDVDVVMMVHPATRNATKIQALACSSLDINFWGRASHAAACPQRGINALEALILSFNSINSLRQHIDEGARIHGIITSGGEAPNIVPAHSAASFMVRARDDVYLEELKMMVLNCFRGASQATGARLEYGWGDKSYSAMKNNPAMANLFQRNLESLGRSIEISAPLFVGSTDMGNVSQAVPSIHPCIAIAPDEISLHTPEFASATDSEEGYKGMMDAARLMAMTAADIFGDPEILREIKREFSHS